MAQMMPEAALLVGGLGTRLRPITYRVPKALVSIRGTPFISHLLAKLSAMGIRQCVLLTGYKHGMVKKYCGSGRKWGLGISYSREKKPLGTGGALVAAKGRLAMTTLAMNGDSWVEYDLGRFLQFHRKKRALASILAMQGSLRDRGAIKLAKGGRVMFFGEKQHSGRGVFNTGVYLLEKKAVAILEKKVKAGRLQGSFSLEREGFPLLMKRKGLYAHVCPGKFLDIGTFKALSEAHRIIK